MLKFKRFSVVLWLLIFLVAAESTFAQCIDGQDMVCATSQHAYTIDPADLPNGTTSTQWSVLGGSLTPPQTNTTANVTWGNGASGNLTARFLDASGQQIGLCTLSVAIGFLPLVQLTPAVMRKCTIGDERVGKVFIIEGYCLNELLEFTAIGGVSYEWSASGGATVESVNASAGTAMIRFSGPAPGPAGVCVTVTGANGCKREVCKSYVVYPPPAAGISVLSHPDASGSVSVCLHESLTFEASFSDPTPFELGGYTWVVTDASDPTTILGGGAGQFFTFDFNQPGTYNVTLTATNCLGCADEAVMQVIVNSSPGPVITCPSVVCQDSKPVEYCAPTTNCANPIWEVVGGTVSPGSTSNCISIVWDDIPSSGFGLVTLTCEDADCDLPTTVEVPIIPSNLNIAGPILICDNLQQNNVYSVPNWPGCTYTWTLSPTDVKLVGLPNGSFFTVDLNNFTGTEYTVMVTVNNMIADCTVSSSLDVTVMDYNIVITPTNMLCFGFPDGSPTFTVTPPPTEPGYQIVWNISSINHFWTTTTPPNVNSLGGLDFNTVFGESGLFTVQALIVGSNGTATCPGLLLNVNVPSPITPITNVTGSTSICPGEQYFYSVVPPGNQYEWVPTGGTITSPANPGNSATVRIRWDLNAPSYGLSVRQRIGNCFSEPFVLDIAVATLPVNFSISSPDFAGCFDVPYTYVASDLNMDSYFWQATGGMILSGQGTHTVQVIWSPNAGPYNLLLNGKFCNKIYPANLIPVFDLPNLSLEGLEKVCQNTAVQYSVAPANGGATYTWYIDGEIVTGQTGSTLETTFPFVGTVTLRVRIENYNGCPGFQDLVTTVTVIPNPLPYITQQGLLYCDEKSSTTLVTQIASGGGNVFEWFHFEGSGYVPVGLSAFSNFYTVNGPSLTINYAPGGGMLGLFKVIVSGGECVSEATRYLGCIPATSNPPGQIYVNFTNWEYTKSCGEVRAMGNLSCEGLVNSWFQVLDPVLPNPFYANPSEICNPNVVIGPFTQAGIYQVALIGEYDFDGNGPNPPVRYADIREITIPYVLAFRPRVTCLDGQNGTYQVDLLNLTQQIPQFPDIQWTWTVDGVVWSNELNPPPLTIQAGQEVKVCLQGYVQVPDDERPGILKDYRCEICEQVAAPTNQNIGIGNVQSNSCLGNLLYPTAIVDDPNLVLSYHWVLENNSVGVHYESNLAAPTFAPPYGGTYTLTLTVEFSNGCSATATQTIEVVSTGITNHGLPKTVGACGETTLAIEIEPSTLPVTYLWSIGQTTPAITVTETGVYTVTVTETGNGCTLTNAFTAIINGPFPSGYRGVFTQCEGGSDIWVQVGIIAGHTYTFTLSNGEVFTFTPTEDMYSWNVPLNPSALAAGPYTFTITASETSTGLLCTTQLTGNIQVNPAAADVSVDVSYSCEPFSALLVANQTVSWFGNGSFLATGQQIRVFAGGTYKAVATNAYGCTKAAEVTVDGPPNVDILTGCYCIEPELIQSGQAAIQPPNGTYTSWAWVLNGSTILASCAPPASCGSIPPLVLQTGWEGDITLQVTQTYTNSDGSTVMCSATSGVFCWEIGPCDNVTCSVPEATTRTIACIEDYGTYQQYHIHWDFVDNGTTHPCNFPQNLPITGAYPGNFVMIDYSLINGYWHFEGIFNLYTTGEPIPEPFGICWEIPFCLNSTGQQCGVANVCPKKDNPQHNDDVIIACYEDDLPYCDNIQFNASIACDDTPNNGVTHTVTLNLSATIDATINTINCPNFSFYITSVTGTLPAGLIRIDVPNVTPVNGQHIITATAVIDWYDQIGIDYVCFQVILAHFDRCWPNDGNICSKRFCFDATEPDCTFERSPYRFTANCSREQGDGGMLYDYTVEFLDETNIQSCDVKNSNPNGFNKVNGIIGNKVNGSYLSYNGNLNFEDVFIINGSTPYTVKTILPTCDERGGDGKGGDRARVLQGISGSDASLRLLPNPNSGQVLFSYSLSESSVAEEHELVVVNALGMVQQRFDLGQFGISSAIHYDASALPNGVYQICLLHGKQAVSVQRMVVLKDE